jgi:CubicO group peptidase (beta-lactamase class C family)
VIGLVQTRHPALTRRMPFFFVAAGALLSFVSLPALALPASARAPTLPGAPAIDAEIHRALAATHAQGLALAVIDGGKVTYVRAFGVRDAAGAPLQTDTVMYGASITKTVMAYTTLQLVDQGKLKLDTPLADDLDKPLPDYDPEAIYRGKYAPYQSLADDPRWKQLTPRMCLTHSTGFANFFFIEPDEKLHFHFDPGTRFAYSGDGFILLQFVIENGRKAPGLGLDVGTLTNEIFARLGMTRTALQWRPDFRPNLADGFNDKGEVQEHDERSKPRVAGSMDTTIADLAKFAAALVRGEGLSKASVAEMRRPQLKITTAHEFPPFLPDLPASQQRPDLYAGLGVVVFKGPQGPGYFKGGHDGQTANTLVCVDRSRRCVLILSNDVRSEAEFGHIVRFILGDTGVPYEWEYGDNAGRS